MAIVSRENHLDGDCNGHCQQRKSFRWGLQWPLSAEKIIQIGIAMVIVSRENHLDGDCNGHCQQRKSFRWGLQWSLSAEKII